MYYWLENDFCVSKQFIQTPRKTNPSLNCLWPIINPQLRLACPEHVTFHKWNWNHRIWVRHLMGIQLLGPVLDKTKFKVYSLLKITNLFSFTSTNLCLISFFCKWCRSQFCSCLPCSHEVYFNMFYFSRNVLSLKAHFMCFLIIENKRPLIKKCSC